MAITRRQLGRLALAGVPAAALAGRYGSLIEVLAQARPNSLDRRRPGRRDHLQLSQMPDQSAEATLKYVVDSGISAIELMGGPVESFAGAPAVAGGGGPWSWRWRSAAAGAGGRPPAAAPASAVAGDPGGAPMGRGMASRVRPAGAGGGAAAVPGGGRGRGDMTPRAAGGAAGTGGEAESVAHQRLDGRVQEAAPDVQRRRRLHLRVEAARARTCRTRSSSTSSTSPRRSGCTHTTLELPTGAGAAQTHRRLRDEEEDLRCVSHAPAGHHDGIRSGVCRRRRATWPTSISGISSLAATSAGRRCSSSRSFTIASRASISRTGRRRSTAR